MTSHPKSATTPPVWTVLKKMRIHLWNNRAYAVDTVNTHQYVRIVSEINFDFNVWELGVSIEFVVVVRN